MSDLSNLGDLSCLGNLSYGNCRNLGDLSNLRAILVILVIFCGIYKCPQWTTTRPTTSWCNWTTWKNHVSWDKNIFCQCGLSNQMRSLKSFRLHQANQLLVIIMQYSS